MKLRAAFTCQTQSCREMNQQKDFIDFLRREGNMFLEVFLLCFYAVTFNKAKWRSYSMFTECLNSKVTENITTNLFWFHVFNVALFCRKSHYQSWKHSSFLCWTSKTSFDLSEKVSFVQVFCQQEAKILWLLIKLILNLDSSRSFLAVSKSFSSLLFLWWFLCWKSFDIFLFKG